MMKFLSDFKKIDVSIVNIMRLGFRFSFILCIFFTYILFLYTLHSFSHVFFDIGYLGVKCSFMFFVSFFVGALVSDKIRKNIIWK